MACTIPQKDTFTGTIIFSNNWPGANIARIWPPEPAVLGQENWAYAVDQPLSGFQITGNLCLGDLVGKDTFKVVYNLTFSQDGRQVFSMASPERPETWPAEPGSHTYPFFDTEVRYQVSVSIDNYSKTDTTISFDFILGINDDSICTHISGKIVK